jgi:hypothetical protein
MLAEGGLMVTGWLKPTIHANAKTINRKTFLFIAIPFYSCANVQK